MTLSRMHRDDKKRKEMIEAKNKAESMVHEAEKNLQEHAAIIKDQDKAAIESALSGLKDAIAAENKGDIDAKTEELSRAMMKIGEDIYKAQQAKTAGTGDASSDGDAAPEQEILDADYEEVKEDKDQ